MRYHPAMGNREDLLTGAKHCLRTKGYARTTIRDVASAAGVSMAAVGYHYGSLEALLNTALLQAMDEWGAEFGQALAAGSDPGAAPAQRYEAMWARAIESFTAEHQTGLASLEAALQAQHSPELRRQLAAGQWEGRRGLVAMLRGVEEDTVSDEDARALGSVQLALISGLLTQWLTDPEHAPTAGEVVAGLRALAGIVTTGDGDDAATTAR